MKRHHMLITLLVLILGAGLTFVAPSGAQIYVEKETIVYYGTTIEVVRTADNFIILYDSSSSMKDLYEGGPMTLLEAEKQIIKEHMDALPELNWNAGLYSHTPGALSFSSDETYYAMKPYDKAEFAEAINKLPTRPSGPTLLNNAFRKLNNAMADIEGRTAVFLFTDGSYTRSSNQRTPLDLAQEMARKYDTCFYVISSAKGEAEERLIASVASINECSRVVPFKDLLGRPEYTIGALFVVQARLVPTFETRERVVGVKTENILFDSDQNDIKPEFYAELRKIGEFLEENAQAYVVLSGFTDSTGDETYNMGLSRKRAESVAGYLYETFNVNSGQVVPLWYGVASPLGSNDTGDGRHQNRRVECFIAGL